jgi:hypothetical protein
VGSGVDVSTRVEDTIDETFDISPRPIHPQSHKSNSIRRYQGDIGCAEVSLESGVGYFASCRVQLLYTAWGEATNEKRNEAQRSRSGATLLGPLPKRYSMHFMHSPFCMHTHLTSTVPSPRREIRDPQLLEKNSPGPMRTARGIMLISLSPRRCGDGDSGVPSPLCFEGGEGV